MFKIDNSKIEGKGVIATSDIPPNTLVGKAITFTWIGGFIPYPIITHNLGVWINHSYTPNTELIWEQESWMLRTTESVKRGDEITVNYNKTPWYIEGALPHYK